jgi:hypothetical protein
MLFLGAIMFEYCISKVQLKVTLIADVEKMAAEACYLVRNLRLASYNSLFSLPEIVVKKVDGSWVHSDCGKESDLCLAIGTAIDQYENG